MTKFALIGTAGFVAPRHFRAIKETGGQLVAAFDPHDAVGQLDEWFPEAASFTEFERFDRHIDKLRRAGKQVDFLSVCSPNYLHDAHVRFGLRSGMDVVCEKPLVISPWNIGPLAELEAETGRRVWTILQLRLHPEVVRLKKKVESSPAGHVFDVELAYVTPRGPWYHASWKGDESKSGGILTNIGVHLFDLLLWVFGDCREAAIHQKTATRAAGSLQLERANVRWFLSIERSALPDGKTSASRSLTSDGEPVDFSGGFTDLHTESYRQIFLGKGFTTKEAARAVELTHRLRGLPVVFDEKRAHPFCLKPDMGHPFTHD